MAKPIPCDGSSSRSPSSALLSILTILASTANGSPTPLGFLCPSHDRRQLPTATTTITPSPLHSTSSPWHHRISNKYVKGRDGWWRRADSYTLYGSTVPCTSPCLRPTQVSSGNNYSTSASSAPTDDIRDSLPLGWKPIPKPNESRAPLIIALSLVLALLICFSIIGCVFWRKSIIKRRRRDHEAEFKKRQSVPSTTDEVKDLTEKESKVKHKILVRATARWMANVRHAARQRKGKRVATSKSSPAHQYWNNSLSRLAPSLSLPPSRPSSRRSSVVSRPDDLPQPIIGELSMSSPHDTISTTTTSPHANVPISPPAYRHGDQASPTNVSHATPRDRSRSPSQSSLSRIDPHSLQISATPKPFHAAHVATDDKALLERLADLASRPPEDASAHTLDACDTRVSAPAWPDELEEIPPDFITSNDHLPDISTPPCSLFPPPPSKERIAAADFYDEYSFSFEDMATLEPEPEPSAPPFQLGSAPPLDDHQIIPSAPPLVYDTESLVDVRPSAPQWESTSCLFNLGDENPTGQDHDRITSADVLPSDLPGYRP